MNTISNKMENTQTLFSKIYLNHLRILLLAQNRQSNEEFKVCLNVGEKFN